MYTMVLMLAVTSGGDVSAYGSGSGCTGCTGTVVVAKSCTGCTGSYAPTSCTGCTGSCHGSRSSFLGLGLREKLFGGSCHGSCHGTVAPPCCPPVVTGCTGCTGGVITMPPAPMPPKPMDPVKPKTDDPVKPKTESN